MSNDVIISVENLGKKYRISHQGERQRYVALRDVIAQKAKQLFSRGQKSAVRSQTSDLRPPASAPGATSDLRPPTSGKSSEDFWALRDVSFEVKRGDVVGIIGRNGAGKSTLLKILSRITEPTTGRVHLRGRVASLLEVGTGFHPELTGRENVFLNGAILGMSRAEIRKKFDEIVAFAEVEKFLDTPVKRYSSGMYVRLAFAVAAHLEPEILIVDEVLAVGDAAFQKKCLGKMQDVSKGGRTVLFVSHNMQALSVLCSSSILLDRGSLELIARTADVIDAYLGLDTRKTSRIEWPPDIAPQSKNVKLNAISVTDQFGKVCDHFEISKPIVIKTEFCVIRRTVMMVSLHVTNQHGALLFATSNFQHKDWDNRIYDCGFYSCSCTIPAHFLNQGMHYVKIYLHHGHERESVDIEIANVVSFMTTDDGIGRGSFTGEWLGEIRPLLNWDGNKLQSVQT
jgi:lipopolysaccharide transport system ATP-binding protein